MSFPARYRGVCLKCHKDVEKGQYITWSRVKGQKGVYHVDCDAVHSLPKWITGQEQEMGRETQQAPQEHVTKNTTGTDGTEPEQTKGGTMAGDGLLELISQAVIQQVNGKLQQTATTLVQQALGEVKDSGLTVEQVRALVNEALREHFPTVVRLEAKDAPAVTIKNVHSMFPRLLELLKRRKHVYLFGNHGTGKSTGAAQAAQALGLNYGYISLTPQTPESRILGYVTATGGYVRTAFRDCYENGGIFCVDEMDNMSPALATTWNGALENGHMAFPDMLVPKHADFCMVSTGNTAGNGANPSYPERRPFDKAFQDRFIYLKWGYDKKLERAIALAYTEKADVYVDWVFEVRAWAEKNYPKLVPSPRVTYRLAEFLAYGDDPKDVLDEILFKGDLEAKNKVLANVPLPKIAVSLWGNGSCKP